MRFILIFKVLIFFSTYCVGQTYNELISDSTIKDFIKWKLYEDSFKNANVPKEYFSFSTSIIKWQPIELKWDSSVSISQNNSRCIFNQRNKWVDTLITADDKEFIFRQSLSYKTDKWVVKHPTNTMAKTDFNFYFSLPLFSLDKQFAFLKELYYCGQKCGEVRIMIYRYSKSSGWAFYKYLSGGIF